MARSRHKHVLRRPLHLRLLRLGIATAAVSALASPAVAVVWTSEEPSEPAPMTTAPAVVVRAEPVPMRVAPISRSEPRVELEEKPPRVTDHMFATAPVNIRVEPSKTARAREVLDTGDRIGVSGETRGVWVEVVIEQESFWVHGDYLADKKPRPEPQPEPEPEPSPEPSATPEPAATPETPAEPEPAPVQGLSTAPCPTGSDVESGLVPNAVAVHRAVCAAFPEVTSYGGVRPGDDGAHGTGQALDIMVTGATGDSIAEWVRAHASALGVTEVIWSQRIWTVQRSGEGWRWMEDRGSTTANHYDHVHVTVS